MLAHWTGRMKTPTPDSRSRFNKLLHNDYRLKSPSQVVMS